jgi:hypothetical protein
MYPTVAQFETRRIQLDEQLAMLSARRDDRVRRPAARTWLDRVRQRLVLRRAVGMPLDPCGEEAV